MIYSPRLDIDRARAPATGSRAAPPPLQRTPLPDRTSEAGGDVTHRTRSNPDGTASCTSRKVATHTRASFLDHWAPSIEGAERHGGRGGAHRSGSAAEQRPASTIQFASWSRPKLKSYPWTARAASGTTG